MKDYKKENERYGDIGIIGLGIKLMLDVILIQKAIDITWKINMKEIHSKCSRCCKYKRMIERGEMDIEGL